MSKNNKSEIKKLYKQGYGIRVIQRKLGISSPSVVQYHIKNVSKQELVERVIELEREIDFIKGFLNI